MNIDNISLDINSLRLRYHNGDFTPQELILQLLAKAQQLQDDNVWIHLLNEQEVLPYVRALYNTKMNELPLYGIPFAIKDNIDLAGVPTTAACAEYAYTPTKSAFVVQQLISAGAIPLGKTNLDQFATGLVGTRSPYGVCKNAFDPEYIAGGSSSGSAVAVAKGLVSFALGTDTAGSGRVPAAFNNLIGLKPSKGLLSTCGVVPACRSLDCVSVFSLTADDANLIFDITAVEDQEDDYSRPNTPTNTKAAYPQAIKPHFRFAYPKQEQLQFFSSSSAEQCFYQSIDRLKTLGGEATEIDFEIFLKAAKLLYEGPWVAERYAAIESLIEEQPEALHPVTRKIIAPGKDAKAVDAFKAQYQLQAYKKQADKIVSEYDFIVIPTAGTIYTIERLQADPITLNSNLGYYTNFMNLLDYAAVAVPAGFMENGLPFGVTLFASAFKDKTLLNFARCFHESQELAMGATSQPLPKSAANTGYDDPAMVRIVVCGAHMQGLPLNYQLTDRRAKLIQRTTTSPNYRLYALAGGPPKRPGLMRDESNGTAIEVEVWEMPAEHFGSFMKLVPQPLGIGTVELRDGAREKGFLCEAYAIDTAEEVTRFGGWRAYLIS
ncbi:MAG: allophanate hydrolase [Gammaproteobacteria bacterium SG8_11]|nr:MAG: allophanate hydrolase [Gammaproteobacteria bacterium SG8_11]